MPLHPMGDTIFGELVSDEGFDTLTLMFLAASEDFRKDLGGVLGGQVAVDERVITAQLSEKKKLHYMATVTAVGPDCKELRIGDIAVLPPSGGTMVTIVDEETNEPRRVFAISESVVLARWRD